METNLIIKLCQRGMEMERDGKFADAKSLYAQAWEKSSSDYELCIVAHFVARLQERPEDILHWNLEAFNRARLAPKERVNNFYPSLHLCLGQSYEALGDYGQAQEHFNLAFKKSSSLSDDEYGRGIKRNINKAMARIKTLTNKV